MDTGDLFIEEMVISGYLVEIAFSYSEWNNTIHVQLEYKNVFVRKNGKWQNKKLYLMGFECWGDDKNPNTEFFYETIVKIRKGLRNKIKSLRHHFRSGSSVCSTNARTITKIRESKTLSFCEGNYWGHKGKETLNLCEVLLTDWVVGYDLGKNRFYKTYSIGEAKSEKTIFFKSDEDFYNDKEGLKSIFCTNEERNNKRKRFFTNALLNIKFSIQGNPI